MLDFKSAQHRPCTAPSPDVAVAAAPRTPTRSTLGGNGLVGGEKGPGVESRRTGCRCQNPGFSPSSMNLCLHGKRAPFSPPSSKPQGEEDFCFQPETPPSRARSTGWAPTPTLPPFPLGASVPRPLPRPVTESDRGAAASDPWAALPSSGEPPTLGSCAHSPAWLRSVSSGPARRRQDSALQAQSSFLQGILHLRTFLPRPEASLKTCPVLSVSPGERVGGRLLPQI